MSRDIQLTGIQNTHLEEPLEELHQLVADLEAIIEKGNGDPTLAPINERLDELEAAVDAIDQGDGLNSGDIRKRLADLAAVLCDRRLEPPDLDRIGIFDVGELMKFSRDRRHGRLDGPQATLG